MPNLKKSFSANFQDYDDLKDEIVSKFNKDLADQKVLNLKYTPDFVGKNFIIETKGRANDSFPLRWKMFKKWMVDNGDNRTLYKPQNQKECDKTIELILKQNANKKPQNANKAKVRPQTKQTNYKNQFLE